MLFVLACAGEAGPTRIDAHASRAAEPWCERAAPGEGEDTDTWLRWAILHESLRSFQGEAALATLDAALADALDPADPDLEDYTAGLSGVCVLDAEEADPPDGGVDVEGDVAFVTPSKAALSLPTA